MDVQMKRNRCGLAFIVLFAALAVFLIIKKPGIFAGRHQKNMITESTLEKIIKVSDLSVFETVYNGVAQIDGPDDETDFYAYYEATVKAGIDLKEVDIVTDEKNKKISVTLPPVKINEIIVDESSLDYKKADNEMAFQRAYRAAETDVAAEAENETAIYELAGENAANIVEALIKPFVLQLDAEYEMEIFMEEKIEKS